MALRAYCMSFFKLPKLLCKEIVGLAAKFWWSNGEKSNKMHWVAWDKMLELKERGGLGFKDLEAFNEALLGKQVWRLITKPNLLMSKVMKCRYFPKQNVVNAKAGPQD